mmetsp:Transcript_22709/g.30296  ORF Transcript_22709/g.30296 Transcript_22709/m.30296 type:complete len:82 (+) Transcript_22709:153-398(+)|eukprot:CAMPEP_0185599940 /NCGR_PEP_ID=MMETSP0434-20130131/83059_1 /TAXON_ID=626734 ORGANISM="Favella taraikaensis, Strain Fe Narragansett Bay" /NCGR_SAMPLE_ID=MMETSP0434 /ASSEMBLY_ACC=CAM_ASM_000379 /LENGTH=81 /DNA_ID=CAMNT_0028229543 /DNA_START=721 /DNA_END=966 /DNA_ORIENTATION=-
MYSGDFELKERKYDFESYANVALLARQYVKLTRVWWYRIYFSDFLANFGALAISIVSAVRVVIASFNFHEKNVAMLDRLYG